MEWSCSLGLKVDTNIDYYTHWRIQCMSSEATGVYVCVRCEVWEVCTVTDGVGLVGTGHRSRMDWAARLTQTADTLWGTELFHHTFRRPKHSQPIKEQVRRGRDRRQGGNKLGAIWQQPHNRSPLNMRQREWEWEPSKENRNERGKEKRRKRKPKKEAVRERCASDEED